MPLARRGVIRHSIADDRTDARFANIEKTRRSHITLRVVPGLHRIGVVQQGNFLLRVIGKSGQCTARAQSESSGKTIKCCDSVAVWAGIGCLNYHDGIGIHRRERKGPVLPSDGPWSRPAATTSCHRQSAHHHRQKDC